MKILIVHPSLKELGGAEQVFLQTVNALTEKNADIFVLGQLPKQGLLSSAKGNIVKITYSKSEIRFRKFQVYQKFLRHEYLKRRLKRKIGPMDLEILTQDLMYFLGVGAKKVAYVNYPENLWRVEGKGGKSKWFWKLFYLPVSRRLRHYAKEIDILLCNSEYTRQAILTKWKRDATVIYPPVAVENFKPAPKEDFVVTVGRFVSIKNYELVVEVAKRMPHVKFIIIGRKQTSDPYYEKIARSKPENLALMPNLPADRMNIILSKAKLYLHTMVGEHFGISVVEAMAAGCIPVVHNSGGTREIVQDVGYIYNNVDECVDCINRGLASNLEPATIAQHAHKFSSENFKKTLLTVLF